MYRITAMICSTVISITSILGVAFFPTLPYLPPADIEILGWINNIYGMTAISEGTESEKLEAYWNMYRAIMGSSFESFKADMQNMIDESKTSRKMVITPSIHNVIKQALSNANQNGISIGQVVEAATTPQEWVDGLREHGISMSLSKATELKNMIGNNYIGNGQPITLAIGVNTLGYLNIWPYYVGLNTYFSTVPNDTRYTRFYYGDGNYQFWQYQYVIDLSNMKVGAYLNKSFSDTKNVIYNNMAFTLGEQSLKIMPSTISQSASTAINNETQVPITSETELENGEIDYTKSIVINLPSINPYPAIDASQIAEVLRELGVVPLSETQDISETVTQLREEATAKYGDANDYALDLTRYFPFCLPFDVARILQAFVAEPEAPSFSYTINNPFSEDAEEDIVLEIDLSVFDDLASVLRTLETIMFVLGLAVVTRSLYLRG